MTDESKLNKNEPIRPAPSRTLSFTTALGAVVVTLLVIAGALLVVPFTGAIDVGADEAHLPGVAWFLETTQEHSVAQRAQGIDPPADLDAPWRADRGLIAYHQMCVSCHGAPGVDPGWIAQGLNPQPPRLADDSERELAGRSPVRDFWVIKNGIRMTGMAALSPTHGDEEMWNLTAFLTRLPDMSPEAYASAVRDAGLVSDEGDHHHDTGSGQEEMEHEPEGHVHEAAEGEETRR